MSDEAGHRIALDWIGNIAEVCEWFGICYCGWRSDGFRSWQQAVRSAEEHASLSVGQD